MRGLADVFRTLRPYLAAAIIFAAAYDARIVYSRWHASREEARLLQAQEAERARQTIQMLGGGGLKILSFYASPRVIHRGEHATLCYGVYGAKSVRIEPAVEQLHPAVSYCWQVAPAESVEYKLIAEDDAGHIATQRLTLQVAR
jgi:hypothetical protein